MAALRTMISAVRLSKTGIISCNRRSFTNTASPTTLDELSRAFTTPEGLPRVKDRPFLPGASGENMPTSVEHARPDFPFVLAADEFPKSSAGTLQRLASEVRPVLEEMLGTYGAVILRGFPFDNRDKFSEFYDGFAFNSLSYIGGSINKEPGNIMPGMPDPNVFTIEPHNELSFWTDWPHYFFLYCERPADPKCGGENVFVDNRKIQEAIGPAVRQTFQEKGMRFHQHLTVENRMDYPSISNVFFTEDRGQIESILVDRNQSFAWHDDGSLTFWYDLPMFRKHPVTGEDLWFNQVTLNASYVRTHPIWREMTQIPDSRLPFNTYYGDGSDIPMDVIQQIRDISWRKAVFLKLERGDVAVLDNMLVQHGRLGYLGDRRIAVKMARLSTPPA